MLCPTPCNLMNCSMLGFPVFHYLPEFAQTHDHWISDAIQPSHSLSPPSPPAINLSQHQGLFQWVSSPHLVAKLLELQHQVTRGSWVGDWLRGWQWLLSGLAPGQSKAAVSPRCWTSSNITSSLPHTPFPATLAGPLSSLLAAPWPTPNSQLRFKQAQQTPTVGQPGYQACHPAVLSGRRACLLVRTGQIWCPKEWNGKPLQYSCLKSLMNGMNRQKESCELNFTGGKIPRDSLSSSS